LSSASVLVYARPPVLELEELARELEEDAGAPVLEQMTIA